MTRYANLSGNSGVTAYEIRPEEIVVEFRGGERYSYDYVSTGEWAVEQMKRLAAAGQGLATFISRTVRDSYADKLP